MDQIDSEARALLPAAFTRWFAEKGWRPRAHQLELLARAEAGESTLLIAPTGAGKTLAGFLPSLTDLTRRGKIPPGSAFTGIHTLYVSPLKALAIDIERNLMKPVEEMGLPVTVENRTGDTPNASPFIIACSMLGAVVLDLTLAINHRNDRYIAV
ncbi:Lhr-like helicase [Rhizobium leguminosarum]|nr:ATP-dependent Lhr-like helicase [Rhizobium leguminosarum]MDH6271297.1 Lhr-like helicase [Rhizobium leguminosarum]